MPLLHSAAARALGWALVHFLWEGAAVAALLAAILFLGRPASARLRYCLACIALAAMLAAFGVTLAVLWPAPPVTITLTPAMRFAVSGALLPISPPPPAAPDRLSWIVPFWMAGVLIFYARTAGGWMAAQRLRGRAAAPASPEWQERLRVLASRLRVTRPVALLESCLAETPSVMGFLRPVILFPAGLLTGLAPDQLEAILLHELAHIRRHDYAVNVLQSLVEGLLFYHPAVWWVSGIVRAERENCCDDEVVAVRGDARVYVEALAALELLRAAGQPAVAAKGGNLMKRIHRLLEPERPRSVAAPVLAAVLLITPVAWALAAWPQPVSPSSRQGTAPVHTLTAGAATVRERLDQTSSNRSLTVAAPGPALLLTQAAPQQQVTEAQLRDELARPYRKWLNEDVAYIIADEERQAFLRLQTDDEREQFIEQFWLRRDPTPGSVENEYKEEHYRRIAYANEHFASGIPGWKTDRGRIYIQYGPPDEIDDHSAAAPPEIPFQRWRYRHLQGIGDNITVEFRDPTRSGEYYLITDPAGQADLRSPAKRESDRDAEIRILTENYRAQYRAAQPPESVRPADKQAAQPASPTALEIGYEVSPGTTPNQWFVAISVPVKTTGVFNIFGRVTTSSRRRVSVFEDTVKDLSTGVYRKTVSLGPGSYRLDVVMKELDANETTEGARDIQIGDARSWEGTLKFLEAQLAQVRTRLAEANANASDPSQIRSLEGQVQLLEKELNFARVRVATSQPLPNGSVKK